MNSTLIGKDPGAASFYGTENSLDKVLERYYIHPARSGFYITAKERYLDLFQKLVKDKDIILDIGCSFGQIILDVADLYEHKNLSYDIIGIDIDKRQIDNAEKYSKIRKIKHIRFEVCDAREVGKLLKELDLKPNIITSFYAFHHIPDSEDVDINKYKKEVLYQCKNNSTQDARLIIGDFVIPYQYDRENTAQYRLGINMFGPPRILNALTTASENHFKAEVEKGTSEDTARQISVQKGLESAAMERNAQQGVYLRKNEYPTTQEEILLIVEDSWKIIHTDFSINECGDYVILADKDY